MTSDVISMVSTLASLVLEVPDSIPAASEDISLVSSFKRKQQYIAISHIPLSKRSKNP